MSAPTHLPAAIADHPLVRIAADLSVMAWEQMSAWRAVLGADLDAAVVDTKTAPNDLVTRADAQIEALVLGYLAKVRPGDLVVGEEGSAALDPVEFFGRDVLSRLSAFDPGAADLVEVGGASRASRAATGEDRLAWHVDPIDGTVNFVRGIEHFAFSVGVCRAEDQAMGSVRADSPGGDASSRDSADVAAKAGAAGDPGGWLVGLVASPGLGATFVGVRGHGSYRVEGRLLDPLPEPGESAGSARQAVPVAIPATRLTGQPAGLSGRLLATGFAYKGDDRARQLGKLHSLMDGYDDIRRCGSAALDLCMVAEGRVTGYAERGIGIYDYAGGALVAEESGAVVHRGGTGGATAAADSPEALAHLLDTI